MPGEGNVRAASYKNVYPFIFELHSETAPVKTWTKQKDIFVSLREKFCIVQVPRDHRSCSY